MAGDGIRRKRIGGTIRKHLSAELAREVADPRLFALAVQDVNVSGDLSIARVAVRLMFGGETEQARRDAMDALRAHGVTVDGLSLFGEPAGGRAPRLIGRYRLGS